MFSSSTKPRYLLIQNPRMHSCYLGATMLSIAFFLLKFSGVKDIPLMRILGKNKLSQLNNALVHYET